MGIAFDLDGTLVDSIPDLLAAINAVLLKHNLPPSDRERTSFLEEVALKPCCIYNERMIPSCSLSKRELCSEMLLI